MFCDEVYKAVQKIPRGRVSTYKRIARVLATRAYRAVGQALKCNPYAPEVPCHRVVKNDGCIGGFEGESAGATVEKKKRLLQKEGIEFDGMRVKNFEQVLF